VLGEDESGKVVLGKSGEKVYRDLDGKLWQSGATKDFAERVTVAQPMLRVLSPQLALELLGRDIRFDLSSVMGAIKKWAMLSAGGCTQEEWKSHALTWDTTAELVVMKDQDKLKQFWLFQWDLATPYLLSIADFLPASTRYAYWAMSPSATGRTNLQTGLQNLERVIGVLFGVDATGMTAGYANTLVTHTGLDVYPDAYLFHKANTALSLVFERFRRGVPRVTGDLIGGPRLVYHIRQALDDARRWLDHFSDRDMRSFQEKVSRDVVWHDPRGGKMSDGDKKRAAGGGGGGNGSESSDEEEKPFSAGKTKKASDSGSDDAASEGSVCAREASRKRKRGKRESRKQRSAKTSGGTGGGGNSDSDTISSSSDREVDDTEVCGFRLFELLGIRSRTGNLVSCRHSDRCKRHHPHTLSEITRQQARAAADRPGLPAAYATLARAAIKKRDNSLWLPCKD
jgi:hypothetical protein